MPTGKEAMRQWRLKNPEKHKAIMERQREKQREKRDAEKKNKPPIMRKGVQPPDHYSVIGSVSSGGVEYFVSAFSSGNGWVNAKVWCKDRAPIKANYWLAYSGSRFAISSCYKAMKENRPEMLDDVKKIICDYADMSGVEFCCD